MKVLFTLLFSYLFLNLSGQVIGKVINKSGEELPYVVVYDSTYTYQSVTNAEGNFTLFLPQGEHKIYFQIIGYLQGTKSIYVDNTGKLTLDYTLKPDVYSLPEVTVYASGEDPAYPIMRKAIKRRDVNKNMIKTYTAKVYGKGIVSITDAPQKVLGQSINNMGGILDSARQGIIYLSETISDIKFRAPDQFKETILASKVSGDGGGISINSFSRTNLNFYDEHIDLSRSIVSPLADNAFQSYNFKFIRYFFDENNHKIYHISVIPKSEYGPCFKGDLFLADSSFNIHSLDLNLTSNASKSSLLKNINFQQLHKPFKGDKWLIISQKIIADISIFGFKMLGNFHYSFIDQSIDTVFSPNTFNAEGLSFEPGATKKDSNYWELVRPTPLLDVEVKDYIKKDSLAIVWKSKPFLDSIDRRNNKFKLTDIFFGYSASQSYHNISYGFNSLINTVQFNAVEGLTSTAPFYFNKTSKDESKSFVHNSNLKYGFADKQIKFWSRSVYNFDRINLGQIGLGFGRKYAHYDPENPISNIANTYWSLMYKENFGRYYDKRYVNGFWRSEVTNGILIKLTSEYAHRKSLENITEFSFRKNDVNYEPNNIRSEKNYKMDDKIFLNTINFRFRVGQKYNTYPDRKSRIQSKWPEIFLTLQMATPLQEDYADYSKIQLRLEKKYISFNTYGYGSAVTEFGSFIHKNKINDPDLFHFQGNELSSNFISNNLRGYRLLPYYEYSGDQSYLTLFYEHHFDGFLTDKIPWVNKSGIKLVSNAAVLLRYNKRYEELGIGIEGFSIGPINLFRIDYIWSWDNSSFFRGGFKIGLGEIFNRDFDF